MPQFNEAEFLWCLTQRTEDARIYRQIFRPDWIKDPAMKAILSEIYKFTKKHTIPPSAKVLSKIFKEEDEVLYEARYRPALEKIERVEMDLSDQIYLMEKAKDIAICRSLEAMTQDMDFQTNLAGFEGTTVLKNVQEWVNNFSLAREEQSSDLKSAWEKLVKDQTSMTRQILAPCGFPIMDKWTNGGLRSKQIGIFMGPTGQGKSVILLNLAYKLVIQDELDVWFVTNELSLAEQAERMLSRVSGVSMPQIQQEIATVDTSFKNQWNTQVNDRLRITSVNSDISTAELENMMLRWTSISGWRPQVIILDFMERMKPNDEGYERRAEWQWLGAIAKDLVRLSRQHNLVLWTACQTNRSGFQTDQEMTMQMAQSSTRHFQEASVVIGMRKGQGEDECETIEFFLLKNRHGASERGSTMLKCNLETMYISEDVSKPLMKLDGDEGGSGGTEHTAMKANPKK
jgi:replicative DNA helicase